MLDSTVGAVGRDNHEDVFSDELAELELAVVSSSTPARSAWSSYRDRGKDNDSFNDNGNDYTDYDDDHDYKVDTIVNPMVLNDPLSPLSSLANGLGGLNLVNPNISLANTTQTTPPRIASSHLTTPPTALVHSLVW